MKTPFEQDFSDVTTYTDLKWKSPPTRYEDLPQFTDFVLKPARVLVIEDDIWVEPTPKNGHELVWEEELKDDYDYDWDDADPQIIVFRVARSNVLVVSFPLLGDIEPETVLRAAKTMEKLQVDPKTQVQWDAGIVTHNSTAGEYYALIR